MSGRHVRSHDRAITAKSHLFQRARKTDRTSAIRRRSRMLGCNKTTCTSKAPQKHPLQSRDHTHFGRRQLAVEDRHQVEASARRTPYELLTALPSKTMTRGQSTGCPFKHLQDFRSPTDTTRPRSAEDSHKRTHVKLSAETRRLSLGEVHFASAQGTLRAQPWPTSEPARCSTVSPTGAQGLPAVYTAASRRKGP